MLFNPTRDQARAFFVEAWRKRQAGEVLTPMALAAGEIVALHPEYHALLSSSEGLGQDFSPEDGQINPFLHLSLHLAIAEQLSVDQPPGIRAAFDQRAKMRGNVHDAQHDLLECLGEAIWLAQRNGTPLDALAYLEQVLRKPL